MKDVKITIFKDLFKSKGIPYHKELSFVLDRIKKGTSKKTIDSIRNNDLSKEDKNALKSKLPCIMFSGVFTQRNSKSNKQHSGLICLDYDGFSNKEDLQKERNKLINNKYIISVFISPSGNGLKAVLRVPNSLDITTHPKYHKAFNNEFPSDYWDNSGSDISRVCFESYDPNLYVNYEAEIYSPTITDEGFSFNEKTPTLPITNEDVIIDKIMSFNWSKDFREGERNAFIFDLSGAFCEYGVTQSQAEAYIQNNVVIGDFTESEAKKTIASAYKIRRFGIKYFENYSKIDAIKCDIKKGKDYVIDTHKISEDAYQEISEDYENNTFWTVKKDKVIIDEFDFKIFLESNGFKKHYPNGSDVPVFVRVQSNIVEDTSPEIIKDFTLNFLLQEKEIKPWKHLASSTKLFSHNFLLMLDTIELSMLKDTKDKSYLCFKNGVVEVTKRDTNLVSYVDLDYFIWKHHIINRDFVKSDNVENEYKEFINNVSSNNPLCFESVIGYLVRTYKNKSNNKAVILNDEVISDNPEGGTGKGVFCQGISEVRRSSVIDGKNLNDKNQFAYQTVPQDCQILIFDDIKQNFNFENKFSLITEGITLERKNKDAIKLSVNDSPKLIITTNYAVKGSGNSHNRRRIELEFAQYYGEKLTPADDFGHQLFDDWNDEMYTRFFNYMIHCIQVFMLNGIIPQIGKNVELRKFQATTSKDFYDWISDSDNFQFNVRHTKDELFEKFVNDYTDFKKWLSKKKFNNWIVEYAKYLKLEAKQGKSNNNRWVVIENDKIKEEELTDVPF